MKRAATQASEISGEVGELAQIETLRRSDISDILERRLDDVESRQA